jgi:uncharacterized ion transporter superfamily protein YfcC
MINFKIPFVCSLCLDLNFSFYIFTGVIPFIFLSSYNLKFRENLTDSIVYQKKKSKNVRRLLNFDNKIKFILNTTKVFIIIYIYVYNNLNSPELSSLEKKSICVY